MQKDTLNVVLPEGIHRSGVDAPNAADVVTLHVPETAGTRMMVGAAQLIRYGNNGSTVTAVNVPVVSLPAPAGRSRLLHIHRNLPGMPARIDDSFSRAGINVAAR